MPGNITAPQILLTERLILRRPKLSDASAVFEYGSDPEVGRYMDWPVLASMEDAIASNGRALERWESGEMYMWRITVRPDDTPIGAVACVPDGKSAELGFVLARQYWGQGYGTEAARAALDWLRSIESVWRVWASCDAENLSSGRVLEKIGMSLDTILRKSVVRPNLPGQPRRDCVVYSWVREQ